PHGAVRGWPPGWLVTPGTRGGFGAWSIPGSRALSGPARPLRMQGWSRGGCPPCSGRPPPGAFSASVLRPWGTAHGHPLPELCASDAVQPPRAREVLAAVPALLDAPKVDRARRPRATPRPDGPTTGGAGPAVRLVGGRRGGQRR